MIGRCPLPPMQTVGYRKGKGGKLIEVGADGLTEVERRIYQRLYAVAELGENCPKLAALGEPFGYGACWAHFAVKRLERLGWIRRIGSRRARRIEIVATGKRTGIAGGIGVVDCDARQRPIRSYGRVLVRLT